MLAVLSTQWSPSGSPSEGFCFTIKEQFYRQRRFVFGTSRPTGIARAKWSSPRIRPVFSRVSHGYQSSARVSSLTQSPIDRGIAFGNP
jgi:hypothetical protein